MGHNERRQVTKVSYTHGAYYLPPHINSLEKKGDVDSYIRAACSNSLVEIVANGTRRFEGKDTLNNLQYRYYFCRCGIAPTKTSNRTTTHHHRTHRLLKGQLCPFKFRVFFDPDSERWFFPKEQTGSKVHMNHYQKTSLGSIVVPTSDMSKHNKRVMMQMLALNFQTSKVKAWHNIAGEYHVTQDQVNSLHKFFKDGRYKDPTTDSLCCPSKNNIDALLESMTEDPKCSVIWISSSKETAESLITIKTSKKRRLEDKKIQDMRDKKSNTIVDVPYDSSHLDPEKEDTPLKHSERILKSLKLQQANRILLSLAWMDHSAIDKMACFPFVLGMDETDRTNCEERPLFCMVGLDSDNKIFPVLNILMPSRARWAYDFIYNEAIPYLLPESVRRNAQILLTDQGKELVHMLTASVGDGKTFPNAVHRLCAWHIVNRNYHMEVIKKVPKTGGQKHVDNKFISDVEYWMYSFCTSIESVQHEKEHLHQLYLFIRNSRVTPSVKEFTEKFVKLTLEYVLDKIVFYKFMYKIGGHVKVTSFVESYNATLHGSATGPRPNHTLVTAVSRITADCRRHGMDKDNLEERNADRRLTVRTGKDDEETDLFNHAAQVLSPHLTTGTVERLLEEWTSSTKYIYMKDESFVPCSDSNGHEYNECYFVCWNPKVPRWCRKAIPSWAYARKVYHITFKRKRYLSCNCGYCHRMGSACRHMYSLLSRKPLPDDSSPRCMKLYKLQYWKNPNLTKAVDSYLMMNPFGYLPLQEKDVIADCLSRGTNCATVKDESEVFINWIQKIHSSTVVWPESAFYEKDTEVAVSTDENLKDVKQPEKEETIIQEKSGFDKSLGKAPNMPVFVVPGAPVLMATPQRPSKLPPLSAKAGIPPRSATETLKQSKKRMRDEVVSKHLKMIDKAKTENELMYLYQKADHTEQELEAKHAASDAYGCITDNLNGTISCCVPITQSSNKGRLKKVNEVPSSTKKKLKF